METLILRYSNFQKFCFNIDPDNEFVKLIQTTSHELFLSTIRLKATQMKSEAKIIEEIFETSKIDKTKMSPQEMDKLKRSIQYFSEIASL